MAKKQAGPFNTILQVVLLGITLFLGWQIIQGGFNREPDKRSVEELSQQLEVQNAKLLDVTAQGTAQALLGKLNEQLQAGKITPQQKREAEVRYTAMVADAKYRGGLALKDSGRLTAAYHQLHGLSPEIQQSPEWTAPITIGGRTVTAKQLHDDIRTDLSTRLEQDPVMMFFPGYKMVDWLVQLTGAQPWLSYWLAALILAVIVRAIIFYPAHRTQMFFRQMSQLQPLVKEIQQKHKEEPQEAQVKVMALYKEYGINPAAGCLPVLLQMPLFLIVYQSMQHYQFEFTKGYFLWVNPWTSAATNGFTAPNLGERDVLMIIVYGITMIIATLLAPVTDPSNLRQQRLMSLGISVVFVGTLFFWPIASAFVVYWIFTNIFSTAQSLWGYRQPLPPLQKVNAPHGAVKPASGFFAKMMDAAEEAQKQKLNGQSTGSKNGSPPAIDAGPAKNPGTPKQHKRKKKK